ncbi:hypothetical protein EJ02DRAFT_409808 [Clathrospora elynae]|uniref:Yeast cell wall synthesis Kre9/Knh1-like N-terminal domain-containing protein n=1 Tax=Clathrospora elynae TaxID=706981 RepID=A0A6A5SDP4_9PLEO|nr:hypothetical protein EJ02DRAFT_409808 [Clathrospora elynae]
MYTSASIVTIFASLAAAQLHAATGEPKGNAITRPLNEVVPACKAFTITWEPTTPNTVSVLLLKGPATNVVKYGPSLAEGIANSGSLAWTPASTLEATTGPTGYGIQIIDDVTGQYQYSTQFGISKDACSVVISSSAAPVSSAAPPEAASTTPAASTSTMPTYPTAAAPNSTLVTKSSSAAMVYGTGAPHGNGTVIMPTKSMSVPASLSASSTANSTTSRLPESTGAASALSAGLSFAGAAAAIAFML